jgi:lipopolysaccharide biosynthesis regulator YciM
MTRRTAGSFAVFAALTVGAVSIAPAFVAPAIAADKRDASEQAYEHRSRGLQAEKAGHAGAALVEYRTALRFDPSDAEAAWRAGTIELRLGHAQAAIPLLERAARGHLDAGGAEEIDLARAYEQVGKIADARRVLEREAVENPTFVRVHLSLIGLLARHAQCDEARALMARMEKQPALGTKEVVATAEDARAEVAGRCGVQAKR